MSDAGSITVRVPLAIRRRPGRKTVVTPAGEADALVRVRADPALVKALARAFRWQRLLDEGRYGSISEMARAEKIERGYLGKMLQLTLLAPESVEAILEGRCSSELSTCVLLEKTPTIWLQHRCKCAAGMERSTVSRSGGLNLPDARMQPGKVGHECPGRT